MRNVLNDISIAQQQILTGLTHQFNVGASLIYHSLMWQSHTKYLFPHNGTNKNWNKSSTKNDSYQSTNQCLGSSWKLEYIHISLIMQLMYTHKSIELSLTSRLNITCFHKSPSHPLSSISPGLSWFIPNVLIIPAQSMMQQL